MGRYKSISINFIFSIKAHSDNERNTIGKFWKFFEIFLFSITLSDLSKWEKLLDILMCFRKLLREEGAIGGVDGTVG